MGGQGDQGHLVRPYVVTSHVAWQPMRMDLAEERRNKRGGGCFRVGTAAPVRLNLRPVGFVKRTPGRTSSERSHQSSHLTPSETAEGPEAGGNAGLDQQVVPERRRGAWSFSRCAQGRAPLHSVRLPGRPKAFPSWTSCRGASTPHNTAGPATANSRTFSFHDIPARSFCRPMSP